jgi:uncharacterized membrane protein
MQIDSDNLSIATLAASGVATLGLAALAARRVRWRTLSQEPPAFHRSAICAVGLMVIWSIRTDVPVAPGLHVLGVTTVTLVLGVSPAALVTLLAQAVTGAIGGDLAGIPANWLASSAIPIALTELWRRLVLRLLPPDPFAFIFGSAFFGAAIAVAAAYLVALALGQSALFGAGAVPSWGAFLLLVGFPEAFINGTIITLLVVYVPDQLAGYDPVYQTRRPL